MLLRFLYLMALEGMVFWISDAQSDGQKAAV